MARVVWTGPALTSLKKIGTEIAQEAPMAAKRVTRRIREATRQLRTFPEIGAMIPELGNPAWRELLEGPYRIVYTIHGTKCYIVKVVHGRQDFLRALRGADLGP